jgi:hypothetical protein
MVRRRRGFTVGQVAWRLGISPNVYRSLEAGEPIHDFDTWDRICKLYGWPAGLALTAFAGASSPPCKSRRILIRRPSGPVLSGRWFVGAGCRRDTGGTSPAVTPSASLLALGAPIALAAALFIAPIVFVFLGVRGVLRRLALGTN